MSNFFIMSDMVNNETRSTTTGVSDTIPITVNG